MGARRKAVPEEETPTSTELPVAPAALEGKKASEPAIVRWVARHIDHPHPDPGDCPDPFAWTLLRQCRTNPEFLAWFTEKLWAKLIPSRSTLDTGRNAGKLDGQPTLDLIARIQAMRDESVEEEETPPPKVAAPIHDYFSDFDPRIDDD